METAYDEIAALRAIESMSDDDDGESQEGPEIRSAPPRETRAEPPDDDEDDLSPDELVAAMVEQDRLARGETETPEETATTPPAVGTGQNGRLDPKALQGLTLESMTPEALRQLQELALSGMEFQEQAGSDALARELRDIDANSVALARRVKAHFNAETERLLDEIDRDSMGPDIPDPDVYRRSERRKMLATVERQWQVWLATKKGEVEAEKELVAWRHNRDAFVTFLIDDVSLPDTPYIREQLLKVADPDLPVKKQAAAMEQQAGFLVEVVKLVVTKQRERTQDKRELAAREIARTGAPHPAGTGKPATRRARDYTGSVDELRAIERLRD